MLSGPEDIGLVYSDLEKIWPRVVEESSYFFRRKDPAEPFQQGKDILVSANGMCVFRGPEGAGYRALKEHLRNHLQDNTYGGWCEDLRDHLVRWLYSVQNGRFRKEQNGTEGWIQISTKELFDKLRNLYKHNK